MIRAVIIRFAELMLSSAVLSASASALFCMESFKSNAFNISIILLGVGILFLMFNMFCMRRCFWEIGNYGIFYVTAFVSYVIFAALGFGVYIFFGPRLHMWIFGVSKVVTAMSSYKIPTLYSTMFFHALMVAAILIAPIGIRPDIREEGEEGAEDIDESYADL